MQTTTKVFTLINIAQKKLGLHIVESLWKVRQGLVVKYESKTRTLPKTLRFSSTNET